MFENPNKLGHFFDAWAEANGWDVRDPRGKSARVFAPGSRPRVRREKEWHEKKDNRDLLWKIATGGAAIGGIGLGVAAARAHAGLKVNPFKKAPKPTSREKSNIIHPEFRKNASA